MCLHSAGPTNSTPLTTCLQKVNLLAVFTLLLTLAAGAQNTAPTSGNQAPAIAEPNAKSARVTVPAGTQVALVLTYPIESRQIRRGDDIYAQVTAPVLSGSEIAIPPGTFVQGVVEKLGHHGERGELQLQSMSITFPDGYVAPLSGPVAIQTNEGYAIKDPGAKRSIGSLALPAAGAGVGALIGYAAGQADSNTTTPFPPGCTGGPPFCTTTTTPVFGTKGRDAIIGAGIGGAAGFVASMTLLFRTRDFYIDAGAPVQITLSQPVLLDRNEVEAAVQQSAEHPVYQQPILPRPVWVPPVDDDTPGIPAVPGTLGTPPVIMPGPPGPDGTPGPPIVIPGTPQGGGTA